MELEAKPTKPKLEIPPILYVYLGGITLLVGLYFLVPGFRALVDEAFAILTSNDRSAIEAWVAGFGLWGPVLIIALMIAQTLVSAVPMILVMIVSVLAYGPVLGGLLGWGGAILAALLGYGLARVLGSVLVDRFVTPKIRKVVEGAVERYGAWAIIALRLSPLVPSDSVSFMAGLVRMKPVPFLLATIAGVTPVAIAVAYFGSSFDRLRTLIVVVTILSLSALIGYVIYDQLKHRRAKSAS